ncbi:MAG: glucokinase [Actinomycetota bacterium]|nr:glucokinase [Actinomycetota bacterium]
MTTIGVDVGGTKVLGVVVDGAGSVVASHRVSTPSGGDAVVEAMVGVIAALRRERGDVVAVGAGVPGLVDRDGVLRFAPNLPGVVELPVGRLLRDATRLPVTVDNDNTCALWGEHLAGAARDAADVVLVGLGTGIGGGLLLDGRLVRGAHGFAGEIGHMVVARGGIPCVCGRNGCWERYASGTALGRMAREAGIGERGEDVTAAAIGGDAAALALFDEFADWFAVGLVNLVHALDVSRCVIAGGLVEAGEVLLDAVRRAFAARLVAPDHRPPDDIVGATLGERAGAIGAALLASRPEASR